MPVATRKQETTHVDLKSLEGAYVELRQLSFDEMLERRDMAMRMSMEGTAQKGQPVKMEFESAMQATRFFEFSRCIAEHNLEDEKGAKLDFNSPMTLKILDPKVGQEIEREIEDMNQEEDEDAEDFIKQHSSSFKTNQESQTDGSDPS